MHLGHEPDADHEYVTCMDGGKHTALVTLFGYGTKRGSVSCSCYILGEAVTNSDGSFHIVLSEIVIRFRSGCYEQYQP